MRGVEMALSEHTAFPTTNKIHCCGVKCVSCLMEFLWMLFVELRLTLEFQSTGGLGFKPQFLLKPNGEGTHPPYGQTTKPNHQLKGSDSKQVMTRVSSDSRVG